MERENEIELVRQLRAGNPAAFDRFVEHFRSKIFQYSWMMCGHREDAEEVAQETLLKVFENFEQLREPERVRSWVFRIAKNACLMKRRRGIFEPAQELSLDELMPLAQRNGQMVKIEIADWSGLPDREVLRTELRDVLQRAMAELPEIYRSVILLRDVEELSTEETAQVLEVSTDVVKTRLHRARLAVRQSIDLYLRNIAETRGGRNGTQVRQLH
ncbi:MAG: sigma-70 family RNA polymerase sigma factor [Bryobacteraceae bacterium]|nr:sigma-70 family RNA polymerase sigma factor [Bryobacteraceae bacterium]